MYDNVEYQGMTLRAWVAKLNNRFTIGELYWVMQQGQDFNRL